ncbi:MAG: hypothetical protein PHQ34_14530 [Methanothrix sp.]|nr:hypothetical protein [Methanothrix sp.]
MTNISSMKTGSTTDYSTIITAGSALFGVFISQLFELLRRRYDDTNEAKKSLYVLRVNTYSELIKDATNWLSYPLDHKNQLEAEYAPLGAKLRISYLLAQLVASGDTANIIHQNYSRITDREFLENKLIPMLRNDILPNEESTDKPWQRFCKRLKIFIK